MPCLKHNYYSTTCPFTELFGAGKEGEPVAAMQTTSVDNSDQRAAKGGTQKGVGHFFLFRSPFGNRFVTFSDAFGHFFAYPLLPPPFCGRVIREQQSLNNCQR